MLLPSRLGRPILAEPREALHIEKIAPVDLFGAESMVETIGNL